MPAQGQELGSPARLLPVSPGGQAGCPAGAGAVLGWGPMARELGHIPCCDQQPAGRVAQRVFPGEGRSLFVLNPLPTYLSSDSRWGGPSPLEHHFLAATGYELWRFKSPLPSWVALGCLGTSLSPRSPGRTLKVIHLGASWGMGEAGRRMNQMCALYSLPLRLLSLLCVSRGGVGGTETVCSEPRLGCPVSLTNTWLE